MRKNIMTVTATALVMTFIALVSCKRDYEAAAPYQTPAGTAYLRVVHAAPNFGKLFSVKDSFNVMVGGVKLSAYLSGSNPYMTYGSIYPNASTASGYAAVPAGEQEIKLTAGVINPDSITLKTFTKVLAPDTYYTFMITDSINSTRDAAQIFVRDSLTSPTVGYFNLRFIHAVLEDNPVKTVDTIDVFSCRNNRNIYSKITPGTVTTFSQFAYTAQLSDTLYVRRVRSTVNLATINNVTFANQRNYTLYFQGDGTLTTGTRAKSLATYVHK